MVKRKIIEIDESKCNGCANCIPNCHEGAIQIIDNKARLVSDLFCDGLGACLGHCPQGAITVIEREADEYDEKRAMENIVKAGPNTIKAHLYHLRDYEQHEYLKQAIDYLKENNINIPMDEPEEETESVKEDKKENEPLPCGCPGSMCMNLREESEESGKENDENSESKPGKSRLRQWPVQSRLVPPNAPYYDNSHLLVCADCVPFAFADFHEKLLRDKTLVISCPKLDDWEAIVDKLVGIIENNKIKSITVAIMEVPCCGGLHAAVKEAIERSKKEVPLIVETIGIRGEIQ